MAIEGVMGRAGRTGTGVFNSKSHHGLSLLKPRRVTHLEVLEMFEHHTLQLRQRGIVLLFYLTCVYNMTVKER